MITDLAESLGKALVGWARKRRCRAMLVLVPDPACTKDAVVTDKYADQVTGGMTGICDGSSLDMHQWPLS